MTEETRKVELEKAREEMAKVRAKYDAATGRKRVQIGEDLEFWTNKVSFLSQVKL